MILKDKQKLLSYFPGENTLEETVLKASNGREGAELAVGAGIGEDSC